MPKKTIYSGPDIRLDQYLVQLYPDISRSYLQQIIVKQLVQINQKSAKKGSILRAGDTVEVLPFTQPNERLIEPNPSVIFNVLNEFENYIVLEKPPGLPTHPNQFEDKNTLANGLVARYPHMIGVGEDPLRPGIVHRLDSNTSGVMLAALTPTGFTELRNLFNEREIHKTYIALVLGRVTRERTIDSDIAHHPKNIRKMVAITSPSVAFRSRRRNAKTIVEPITNYANYTLVKVKTLTGRMHQVRIHLSSIGHPLVGDDLYQTNKEKNADGLGLTRHFLHAVSIAFQDPWTKVPRLFESKLSQDLEYILEDLK